MRNILDKPKDRCEYCHQLFSEKEIYDHYKVCEKKQRALEELLEDIGEIPY